MTILNIKGNVYYNRVILFIVVMMVIGYSGIVQGFNVEKSTVTHKGTNVMSVEMDFALMDITFDRELYTYTTVSCPNYTCIHSPMDCTCDYSRNDTSCGKPVNPLCTNTCDSTYVDGYGDTRLYCDPEKDPWVTIDANIEYKFDFQYNGDPLKLRFKPDATKCQGYRIYASQNVGTYSVFSSNNPAYNGSRRTPDDLVNINTQMNLCPTDNAAWSSMVSYTNETLFLAVYPLDSYISFSIILYAGDIAPVDPLVTPCTNILPTHTCINDGDKLEGFSDSEIPNNYTFQVDRDMVLTISCPLVDEDIDFFISDDPSNPSPDSSYYKWGAMHPYDDYLTLSLSPINATTPLTLYISIVPYYSSHYICTVTTHTTNFMRKVTDNFDIGGTWNLMGTSRLVFSDGSYLNSDVWDNTVQFYTVFPRLNLNPLWPVPNVLFNPNERFNFFKGVTFGDPENVAKKNSYQAAFILSVSKKSTTIFDTFENVANSSLEFLNVLVDVNGKPLTGSYPFKILDLKCNYDGFQHTTHLINEIENQITNGYSDYGEVASMRFMIDVLTMRDSWSGCSDQANDLLQTTIVEEMQLTTLCPYLPDDPRYSDEPCCNNTQTFFQCCVPRNILVPTKRFVGVHDDAVKSQCSSFDCTVSLLNDYYSSLSDVENGECSLSYENFFDFQLIITNTLRACKSVYTFYSDTHYCSSDAECGGFTCNLYNRRCEPPVDYLDKQYLSCVIQNSSATTIYYMKQKYNLTGDPTDATFINELYDLFVDDDCHYRTGVSYRTTYQYLNGHPSTEKCYPSPICLDSSCETVHDVCYDGYFGGWRFMGDGYLNTTCLSKFGYCQGTPCENDPSCEADCLATPQFCGHCTNNVTACHITNITSSTACNGKVGCLYPSGEVTVLPAAQCLNSGRCTKSCGFQCASTHSFTPVCVAQTATSQSLCTSLGASVSPTWHASWGDVCTTNQTKTSCTSSSRTWVDCPSLAPSECYAQVGNVSERLTNNMCQVVEKPCANQAECEGVKGGSCSDSYFFDSENTLYYNQGLGKCLHGHYMYKSNWNTPTCNDELENDSPLGCYVTVPEKFTKQSCEAQPGNFRWWSQALNKTECESYHGCRAIDESIQNLPNNYRYNEMNQSTCQDCADVSHEWRQMFKWTQGQWLPGIPVNLTWLNSTYIHSGEYGKVLNHERFADEIGSAYYTRVADLLRSASLCRMERLEESLNSISCSCSGPGGSECFQSSAVPLGQSKPCAGEQSEFEFSFGMIQFSPSSVALECTPALVYQVSRQLYKSFSVQTLSSNFVSYRKPDDYALLNSKGGVIGTILSDGVKINAQGVGSYKVCFATDGTSEKYPVLDIVKENTNGSVIGKSSSLEPMNAHIEKITFKGVKYMCAQMSNVAPLETYFPVSRVDGDWNNVRKEVFDKGATGLIYTLAVIFLLNGLWGLYQIVVVGYKRFQGLERLKLVHALILTVTIFIMIRSVYFFILPSGKLAASAVADYILVVLPTFIYFTAFTIITVLWYIIVKAFKSRHNLIRRLGGMVGTINVILYLLFIIIILVFHYTNKIPTNDCGGRMVVSVSTNTAQRIVSIVYAVVQAIISLIIGAAFIYLGGSIYAMMRVKKPSTVENSDRDEQQRKISIVTSACSVGFILHCVFVLILVGAQPSNIIFSFIGLLVTEIIPVVSILYSYNQGHLNGIRQVTDAAKLSYVTSNTETFGSNASETHISDRQSGYYSNTSSTRDSSRSTNF